MADDGLKTHTMWSETLLDGLYDQLRSQQGNDQVEASLRDLIQRDLPSKYLVRCVRAKVGEPEAQRIERLLADLEPAKPAAEKAKPDKASGFMSSLKGLLK